MLENQLNKIIKKNKLQSLIIEPTDNYYDHTTFSVSSLSEFIMLIEAFCELNKKTPYLSMLYRGMADSRWQLIPSLIRKISEIKYGFTLEHDLAVEFSSEMPSLFKNADSNFERIAKMQHFGIPTRLLDFTLNPLIALYFACSEHNRTEGRVVFTSNKIHHYDEPCVECTSSLYLYDDCDNVKVDEWLRPYNISVSDYLFKTFSNIYLSSPLFVKPLYLDERMRVQRSVFLLFHNCLRDLFADNYYYKYSDKDSSKLKYENIEEIYKEQIAHPRMMLGISPLFILDKISFGRMSDFYRGQDMEFFLKQTDKAFSNRFCLQSNIDTLEMTDIWCEFSSIIIPSKYKKTILSQLESIGIDEAYVYPEAEHVANRVRTKCK